MKLYKFRPLANCQDLDRAQQILETGRFWCSRFWELNDPMEGVYWFYADAVQGNHIRQLYDDKARHLLCAFSGERAFADPLLWGYYANGFKGIAIEIEASDPIGVEQSDLGFRKMHYASDVPGISNGNDPKNDVRRILTTKLCCWSHEDEYRYLVSDDPCLRVENPHEIGEITAVFFGDPYRNTVNAEDVWKCSHVRQYHCRAESLKQTAQMKGLPCRQVDIEDGRVVPLSQDDAP